MNNKCTFRRAIAYLLDFVIITVVSSLFARISILNPDYDKQENVDEKYIEYVQEISESENAQEMLSSDEMNNYLYDIAYYGKYTTMITIIVSLLYFSVFQFYNKGKTVGKAVMKINVINVEKENLKLYQVFLRSIIADGMLIDAIALLMLVCLSKPAYIKYYEVVDIVKIGITFLTFGMMVARNDGRGLHDVLAGTNVVEIEEE